MELLLIRHGRPVRRENTDGPADPGLDDAGADQATRLADYLSAEPLEAVYTSPMARARQTAEPLARAFRLEMVVEDDLAEYDRLADTYIPLEELKAAGDPRYRQLLSGQQELGDETPDEFAARVVAGVERLVLANPGRQIAAVCHGGVINAYLAHVLGIGLGSERGFFFPNYTSVHRVVAARSGERSLASLNEISHLRGTGARAGLLD